MVGEMVKKRVEQSFSFQVIIPAHSTFRENFSIYVKEPSHSHMLEAKLLHSKT